VELNMHSQHLISIVFFLASLAGSSGTWAETKLCTNPVLASQDEVNAFDCDSVSGNLSIIGEVNNVDGLSMLTSVEGNLVISGAPALDNLDGLANLTSVGGDLTIAVNPALDNCQGIAPLLGWPSGPPNDGVGGEIDIKNNGGAGCNSVEGILASVPEEAIAFGLPVWLLYEANKSQP
jgi:hypothetical protein